MKTKKLYFMECHVAGRQYHDADEVWNELKVGTKLRLVRDLDNRYDPKAVAIVYDQKRKGEEETEEFVLGYIPKDENEIVAALLEMGWNDIFECRICKLDEETQYENQIHVTLRIVRNEKEGLL